MGGEEHLARHGHGIELKDVRSAAPSESVRQARANTSPYPRATQGDNEESQAPLAKTVKLKLLSCCLCFLVAGLNDGSIGALISYLIKQYDICTSFVGVVYAGSLRVGHLQQL
jgi:hypothetical protein